MNSPYTYRSGRAIVLRGDARHLPLPDGSVDLIVTSPPYWQLRSYTDAGGHYDGQIGSEPTWQKYIDALVNCTREWTRVLKPTGSLFVNLGDKYSGAQQQNSGRQSAEASSDYWRHTDPKRTGIPAKSLMDLPHRYAIRCVDELGLIKRAEICWSKPNGLPESVQDRVRRSHEMLFHFTVRPRYFSAVDEIREAYAPETAARYRTGYNPSLRGLAGATSSGVLRSTAAGDGGPDSVNPLGKLPGSVWDIASQPLTVPPQLGVDHFAAFPMELPRRIILGWSPPGVCTACGEGRRPVVDKERRVMRPSEAKYLGVRDRLENCGTRRHTAYIDTLATVTGYACACTPYTDHPYTGSSGEGYNRPGEGIDAGHRITFPETPGPPSRLGTRPKAGGGREYHFDRWTPPPTRPALVVDPFGGTGTTALVAAAYGRHGITVDMSADYCRLAAWRTTDPAQRAAALEVPKPPPVPDGQGSLFTRDEVAP